MQLAGAIVKLRNQGDQDVEWQLDADTAWGLHDAGMARTSEYAWHS